MGSHPLRCVPVRPHKENYWVHFPPGAKGEYRQRACLAMHKAAVEAGEDTGPTGAAPALHLHPPGVASMAHMAYSPQQAPEPVIQGPAAPVLQIGLSDPALHPVPVVPDGVSPRSNDNPGKAILVSELGHGSRIRLGAVPTPLRARQRGTVTCRTYGEGLRSQQREARH